MPLVFGVVEAKRDFDVAANHFLFQQAAQLHFQRIGIGRQPEMKIEKTMIDRLERQREGEAGVGLASDLRVSRHGAKWHKVSQNT